MALLPAGTEFHEFTEFMIKESSDHINLYAQIIAKSGNSMGPIPHRGNGKTSIQFPYFSTPRVKLKHNIKGTIKRYSRPEVMIWDDIYQSALDCKINNILPKSLALLDAEDILTRDCMEDDCTWKQGQVAMWCNKYPKKGRKR